MKKLLLFAILAIGNLMYSYAQNDTVLYIENCQDGEYIYICLDKYTTVNIYAEDGCTGFIWYLGGQPREDNPLTIESQSEWMYNVSYHGCNIPERTIWPNFKGSRIPNSFTRTVWKRYNETVRLEAVGIDSLVYPFHYEFHWSTGETTSEIEVSEPGIYTCEIIDACGSAIRTFIVQDNVELYRATVDLETNLNKVTWQTTPEQAEYISEVRVERDGMGVGSAPYEQGYFMDNIGSENAARNYRLTAITTEGTECPIPSYQKGTLHVDYSPNASNPNKLNMAWTPPFIEERASISVTFFQICKYDPNTGEVTVVDQIGANNTIGSYDISLFDGGYATVAALFSEGKDYEDLAFSNLTEEVLGTEENTENQIRVYPNPAKDQVIIEGTGTLTVTNTLGQTILTKEIDEKTTIELPQGMYFVKLGGTTRKIVVE